jgi:CubicO group peptidase (beta-lactamase class C family)
VAVGYGGQFLVVVPERDAVVVVLATHDGKGAAWDRAVVRDIRTLVTEL